MQGPLNGEERDRRFRTREMTLSERVGQPLLALQMEEEGHERRNASGDRS